MSNACAELYGPGKRSHHRKLKRTFLNLAKTWSQLAAELEDAKTLMSALNGMALKIGPEETFSCEGVEQGQEVPEP